MKIIENIIQYANNIFICCNNLYKDNFIKFAEIVKYNNIKFLYYNSLDNSQNFPNGNGETVFQLLQNEILTSKIFIIWGDIYISNNKIFEEMYNLQYDNDFLIPVIYDKNPYAYLIIDINNNIEYNISNEKFPLSITSPKNIITYSGFILNVVKSIIPYI